MNEIHLTPEELSERWRGKIKTGTLSNWRHKGGGPAYKKLGRAILYPISAVEAFEAAATKTNTAQ